MEINSGVVPSGCPVKALHFDRRMLGQVSLLRVNSEPDLRSSGDTYRK